MAAKQNDANVNFEQIMEERSKAWTVYWEMLFLAKERISRCHDLSLKYFREATLPSAENSEELDPEEHHVVSTIDFNSELGHLVLARYRVVIDGKKLEGDKPYKDLPEEDKRKLDDLVLIEAYLAKAISRIARAEFGRGVGDIFIRKDTNGQVVIVECDCYHCHKRKDREPWQPKKELELELINLMPPELDGILFGEYRKDQGLFDDILVPLGFCRRTHELFPI